MEPSVLSGRGRGRGPRWVEAASDGLHHDHSGCTSSPLEVEMREGGGESEREMEGERGGKRGKERESDGGREREAENV